MLYDDIRSDRLLIEAELVPVQGPPRQGKTSHARDIPRDRPGRFPAPHL